MKKLRFRDADAWNRAVPIGTRVLFENVRGSGQFEETVTQSEAWALGGGRVVVLLKGRTGGCAIDHLSFPDGAP